MTFYFYTPTSPAIVDEIGLCGNAFVESPGSSYPSNLEGEKIFKQNCAVCHNISSGRITGPGLQDILSRVPNETWLIGYISNCDSVFKLKDAYALKLRKEFPESRMTIFSTVLSHSDIEKIISYIKSSSRVLQY